jgi:hypothetical protein
MALSARPVPLTMAAGRVAELAMCRLGTHHKQPNSSGHLRRFLSTLSGTPAVGAILTRRAADSKRANLQAVQQASRLASGFLQRGDCRIGALEIPVMAATCWANQALSAVCLLLVAPQD